MVTCSASVTKAKHESPGPKTGKASSQAQLHCLKACNRHYQRKEELSKQIKGGEKSMHECERTRISEEKP